jgi:hypothetical protein
VLRRFRELQRSSLVKIGNFAAKAELRKEELIIGIGEEVFFPT